MKIYRSLQRFFCTPLKRYIPQGALLGRYENATRIVLQDAPQSDQDPFITLIDGFVFDDPTTVSWLYHIEPPPLGTNTTFFELLDSKTEDSFGNVSVTEDGLPAGSKLKIHNNIPYLWNITTGKWHAIRVSGPDGNVSLDIDQNGVVF
jgi:hypothetical protein